MKYITFLSAFIFLLSCSKENKNRWDVNVNNISVNLEISDFSKDFYDTSISLPDLKNKYSFFISPVYDDTLSIQRRDTFGINLYSEIEKNIDKKKLEKDLIKLFKHIKYYYPDFKEPKIYFYSSLTNNLSEPISYLAEHNYLTVSLDAFLGFNNKYYSGIVYDYLQESMSQNYLVPKVSEYYANSLVSKKMDSQNFLSRMIYQGKIMTLQDAFLPDVSDEYKIGFSKQQLEWTKNNEYQIWTYFVEKQYLFNQDQQLTDRFLKSGPFSKFYLELDHESPARIGCWTGWQIIRKYLDENADIKLIDFLENSDAEDIFRKSNYKPIQNN